MSSKWKIHKRKKVAKEELIRDFNYSGIELEESGLYGLDDEPATLGGIETMENIDFTEDYDVKPDANIDPDETHIFYGDSPEEQEKRKIEMAKKEPPYDPKKVIKHKIPDIGKSVKNYQRKKSGQNLRKIIVDLIDFVPHTINYCVEYVMYHYCYHLAYKESKKWSEYEQAHADACATIMKLITIPLAAIVVLNWWYLLNYTNFYIDTDNIFKTFPLSALETILAPTAKIIGGINNFLMGKRLFSDTSSIERNIFSKMWDYRPITISLFFIVVYTILQGTSLTDVLKSAVLGKPNPIFYSVMGLSILLYIFILMNETAIKWMATYANIIVVGILSLLCLIGVILFSYLGVFIVFYYFVFFSIFFIFAYNGFNLKTVFKEMNMVKTDLVFSTPFFNDTGSLYGKMANELLRNSFNILTSGFIPVIGLYGYTTAMNNLGNKVNYPTNMMRLFYGLFVMYGSWNLFSSIESVWKQLKEAIGNAKELFIAEAEEKVDNENIQNLGVNVEELGSMAEKYGHMAKKFGVNVEELGSMAKKFGVNVETLGADKKFPIPTTENMESMKNTFTNMRKKFGPNLQFATKPPTEIATSTPANTVI